MQLYDWVVVRLVISRIGNYGVKIGSGVKEMMLLKP